MKQTYVRPTGPPNAKIAIVGEQPGKQEVFRGKPFIGPAGQELSGCLHTVGISRQEVYLTNVIKDLDRPLRYYMDLSKRSPVISSEGWTYINELCEELKTLNPNIVVATGNVPLYALTTRTGITKWRGSVIESTMIPNQKVIGTIHPATIVIPKLQYLNRHLICFDLKRALEESTSPDINRKPRNLIINPSFKDCLAAFEICVIKGLTGAIIEWDIEVVNEELSCFSLAWAEDQAISIPMHQSGDYFTIDQERSILIGLAAILEDPRIAIGGANNIFDCQFMLNKYGIKPHGDMHCTQIAQKISFPDYPAGLDFVTAMHTDIPYYKADGKKWMKVGGSWDEWWTYNAMDSIATSAARKSQFSDLERQENIPTYDRQRRLVPPLLYMMERGIRIDVDGMQKMQAVERKKIEDLKLKLNYVAGQTLNHNSPKQLMAYFYDYKKIKPYKKRKGAKWIPTTDVNAMKRLARRGFEEAQIILDMRSLTKRISTYLNLDKLDQDGRYRSQYKPVGTDTGRLASGETIFGTGGNQQNWPHDLLKFFAFDEGYIGYSFDLSQIENRIVAYVGNILPMIEAFEKGIDLHRLTAALIFNKKLEDVLTEDGTCSLGDGRQSERFYGKKGNHSLNYDFGYKAFALNYEITETQSKWIVEKYHSAYPGVRHNYHAMIQEQLKKDRTLTNLFGRKRVFMGPIVPSYPNVTKGMCSKTFKAAYAHIPQSTTADKINAQGVEYIYYNQKLFPSVELLTQIHDSVVFQIPLSVPLIEHARMLLLIKRSLETPLVWRDRKFTVPADLSIGFNMCKESMLELKSKEIPASRSALSYKLSHIIKKLKEKD